MIIHKWDQSLLGHLLVDVVHHFWALKNCISSVFIKISQTSILSRWKCSTRRELDESSVGEERGSAVALKEEGDRLPNCDNDRFSRIVKVLRCRRMWRVLVPPTFARVAVLLSKESKGVTAFFTRQTRSQCSAYRCVRTRVFDDYLHVCQIGETLTPSCPLDHSRNIGWSLLHLFSCHKAPPQVPCKDTWHGFHHCEPIMKPSQDVKQGESWKELQERQDEQFASIKNTHQHTAC